MFPDLDDEVITQVLALHDDNVEQTINQLLEMADPDAHTNTIPPSEVADAAYAQELAQHLQDEDLARQLQAQEHRQQAETHLSSNESGMDLKLKEMSESAKKFGNTAKEGLKTFFGKVSTSISNMVTPTSPIQTSGTEYTDLPKDEFEDFLDHHEPLSSLN